MNAVALELASISKRFGPVAALDSASLLVHRGTVHALLGENGAGKTTLMRIAFGMVRPDSGTIAVDNTVMAFGSPGDAITSGIGMVHQHFTLVPAMTVTENIALGGHGWFHPARTRDAIARLTDRTGLAIDPDERVSDLPTGAQQRVEILKALSHDARVLILDEPTAVLTPAEARDLLHSIRQLVNDGATVVLITHKLRDAIEFADHITVLRHGATVWTGPASDATESSLVSAMLGADRLAPDAAEIPSARAPSSTPVMSLRNVSAQDDRGVQRLSDVTMTVRGGEIVGIAAVEGNGQRELLRILAGRMLPASGDVAIPDVVGFIPEDRQRDALIQDFSLRDNLALLGAGSRKGTMDWRSLRDQTRDLLRKYDVRARDESVRAATLSGGNQQKFIIGREIEGSRKALVAENPSRGLDVQATAAVHRRLRAARDAGMAVVIYSSDLDEVIGLSDRVIVVWGGHVREVVSNYESIGRAMLGLADQ